MIYEAAATVIEVHDGDTVHLQISRTITTPVNPWFGMEDEMSYTWKHDVKVRLARINAPEIATPMGIAAKAVLIELLSRGTLRITTAKRDKYDRPLAEIFVKPAIGAEINVSDRMVALGAAKTWNGEGPKPV